MYKCDQYVVFYLYNYLHRDWFVRKLVSSVGFRDGSKEVL